MMELLYVFCNLMALCLILFGLAWLLLKIAYDHWERGASRRADDLLNKGVYLLLRFLPLKRDAEYEDNHYRKYRFFHEGVNGWLIEVFFDQDCDNGDSISVWKNGSMVLNLHENIGEFHVAQMDYIHTILESKDPEW